MATPPATHPTPPWADARLWTLLMVAAAILPAAVLGTSNAASLFNRFWVVGVLTPVVAALAVASAVLAWKGRPLPALLTTTAYGSLVGVLPALAVVLTDVGYPLGPAFLLAPLVPAVPAAWGLAAAWLGTSPSDSPPIREARRHAAARLAAALAGYAAFEALVLGGLVLASEAPCNAAGASQTACSTTAEGLLAGLCFFAVLFPVLAPILLGLRLKNEERSLLGATLPGTPPR